MIEQYIIYNGFTTEVAMLLLSLLVLLILSALASSSEVAFFSLTPQDKSAMEKSGGRTIEIIDNLLERGEELLATILVVNNLVNIAIVIIAARIMHLLFTFSSIGVEFLFSGVLATFILLLFGEIMPKVFAQDARVKVAKILARPMIICRKFFHPLSFILMRTSNSVAGIAQHDTDLSIEDLADAVDMTQASSSQEQQILTGIVNFTQREVEEIMRPRIDIVGVENNMTASQVKEIVIKSGYSRLPVYDGSLDHIVGILYVKDLIAHLGEDDSFKWQTLVREPYMVPMHKRVNNMLEDFQMDKVHMAIIVDEYGATQGLVTLEDVLEEVVGEISDESDVEESFYRRLNENTYLFEGKTHIVDMLRVFNLDDETFADVQGRAETIAGLLLEIKRGFLKKDEEITCKNIRFIVDSIEGHKIDKIKIIVPRNE